jgi:hypothetical protein
MIPALFLVLTLLVLVGAPIVIVVTATRDRSPFVDDPGIGTIRRVFIHVLAIAGLATAAAGVAVLLRVLVDAVLSPSYRADDVVALGLALATVGTPVWLGFWWLSQRALRQHPVEARFLTRKLYLYTVATWAALATVVASLTVLPWILGNGRPSAAALATLAVGIGVWAYHWRIEQVEGKLTAVTGTVRRLHVYGLSLLGVGLLAIGIADVLHGALAAAYRTLFAPPYLLSTERPLWNDGTRFAVSSVVIGGALWWHAWHRVARGDDSWLRSAYLYVFMILAGATTFVGSTSVILYHALQWWLATAPGAATSAAERFGVLPGSIAAAVVGGSVWGYHAAAARADAFGSPERARAGERAYLYLVTALGLVTLAVGLTILLAAFLGLLASLEERSVIGGMGRDTVVLGVTLLAVGTPVWASAWRGLQRRARRDPLEERRALARRVFIYATFGISMLVALVNLSIVLFSLLSALLTGASPNGILWEMRSGLAVVLTAGTISGYYWLVQREDRTAVARLEPSASEPLLPPPLLGPHPRTVVAVAADASLPVVRRLEAHLGADVTVWRTLDDDDATPHVSDAELAAAAARIEAAASRHVMVLLGPSGITVIPYLPA